MLTGLCRELGLLCWQGSVTKRYVAPIMLVMLVVGVALLRAFDSIRLETKSGRILPLTNRTKYDGTWFPT